MNYREATGSTTKSWRRVEMAQIRNPLPGQGEPTITFMETDIIVIGDRTISQSADSLSKSFSPTGSFPLLDPVTEVVVGKMSHGELYAALFSLYRSMAAERDAAAP